MHNWATIKYSNLRTVPLEVQRVKNQLVLSWTNAALGLQCAPAMTGPFLHQSITGVQLPTDFQGQISDRKGKDSCR